MRQDALGQSGQGWELARIPPSPPSGAGARVRSRRARATLGVAGSVTRQAKPRYGFLSPALGSRQGSLLEEVTGFSQEGLGPPPPFLPCSSLFELETS